MPTLMRLRMVVSINRSETSFSPVEQHDAIFRFKSCSKRIDRVTDRVTTKQIQQNAASYMHGSLTKLCRPRDTLISSKRSILTEYL